MNFQQQRDIKLRTLRKLEELNLNDKRSTIASPDEKERFYDRLH